MIMYYVARLAREGKRTLIDFPDCPGCQTFVEPRENALSMAREALEGWLELHLEDGEAPPRPRRIRATPRAVRVAIDPSLAVRLQIRWARQDAKLSQGDLAARVGVTRQQISLLESKGGNLQVATLGRIAEALGLELDVSFRVPHHGRDAA
jgi:antitoxin HicB